MVSKDSATIRKEESATLKKNSKQFFIYFLWINGYGFLGTFIFFYIEHCYDVVPPNSVKHPGVDFCLKVCEEVLRLNLTLPNSPILNSIRNISMMCKSDLCKLERHVNECVISEVAILDWMEFSFSVIFTIGYGRIVTRSKLGKMMTIIYAIFGIPVTAATIVFCGRSIISLLKLSEVFIEHRFLKRHQVKNFQRKILFIQIVFTILFLIIYALLYSVAGTFTLIKLDFLDAFYFVFITVSTIGFGDIVTTERKPASPITILSVVLNTVMFFVSFTLVASLVSTMTNLETEQSIKKKIGRFKYLCGCCSQSGSKVTNAGLFGDDMVVGNDIIPKEGEEESTPKKEIDLASSKV